MELIADRFVVVSDSAERRAIDLATGSEVRLEILERAGESEERAWVVRCDERWRTHRPMAPTLVDYGLLGGERRFEAWDVARSNGRLRVGNVVGGGAIDGVVLVPRRAASIVAELFEWSAHVGPRALVLVGPPGAGKTTMVVDVARLARSSGFVPIAADMLRFAAVLGGRSFCVIDERGDGLGWSAVAAASLRSAKPHVLIATSREPVSFAPCVRLERVASDALVAAVRPAPSTAAIRRRIERAADRAHGLPGLFVQDLWPAAVAAAVRRARATGRDRPSRAAEAAAVYVVSPAVERPAIKQASCAWSQKEASTLNDEASEAVRTIDGGRYSAGVRQLRATIAAQARRRFWQEAGNNGLELSRALLRRGETAQVQRALKLVQLFATRGNRPDQLLDASVVAGEAWTSAGRLDEAECVARAAIEAARAASDATRVGAATNALARCLFWRGRYGDGASVAALSDGLDLPLDVQQAKLDIGAKLSVGLADWARASACASEALDRAHARRYDRMVGAAACTAAFVHLAVGDLEAVERDARVSIAAAHAAHDPLCAIAARLLRAEAHRRSGRLSMARRVVERTRKIAGLPMLLRARLELLDDLLAKNPALPEVVARRVSASGLGALALFAAMPASSSSSAVVAAGAEVEEIVAVIGLCQTADDERSVLAEVCRRLSRQLRAANVAILGAGGTPRLEIASAGSRVVHSIVDRVAAASIVVAPHRVGDAVEGGAPVQYGGTTVGVLAARWTLGACCDVPRATAILTMAAAAAAPLVSAASIRFSRSEATRSSGSSKSSGPSGADALLGVTSTAAELRQAVERAAAAPFPVLIQGESGSGKELVARAIHRSSARRDRVFSSINCAALPDDLIEAELFGHTRGAFTGAAADRAGVFEEAHGGTLFLDEVGELSARGQAKLLRVVQEGEIRRVGDSVSRRVDVRLVAATNRDLAEESAAGRFRADLWYRLDVVRLVVPPLRDRREDVVLLADHFWNDATRRVGSRATLAAATIAALARYDWPGNVRELQNVLASLAVRCQKRGVVPLSALPPGVLRAATVEPGRLGEARRTFEERFVRAALVRSGGHRAHAAAELGVTRQGLTKLMARLGIDA